MEMNYINRLILEDVESISIEYLNYFKKLKNTTILITGGGGFLLSYFVELIFVLNKKFSLNIKLEVYDLFKNGIPARLKFYKKNQNINFFKKDVSKKFKINDKYSIIIHGASIASPTFYKIYPIETLKVNTIGYFNMLDQVKNYKKLKCFIYMSSSEVYGDPDVKNVPTKESYNGNVSFLGSRACYDESKRIGETISVSYFRNNNLPIRIIRPFNVFGPGQNLDDKRFIPDILKNLSKNEDVILFSDGKPKRSFCYIVDQIRGILEVVFKGKNGESYNVGNNQEVSMYNASKKIIKISGLKRKIIFKKNYQINYNQDSPNRRCPDLTKLQKLDGWRPIYSFEEGIKRTLTYYRILS